MLESTDVDCINIQAVWHGGASFVIVVFVCRVVVDFTQNMHDTAHYGRHRRTVVVARHTPTVWCILTCMTSGGSAYTALCLWSIVYRWIRNGRSGHNAASIVYANEPTANAPFANAPVACTGG